MAITKTDPKLSAGDADIKKAGRTYQGLTRQQLIDAYRIMYTSRRLDDREIMLKRQQKGFIPTIVTARFVWRWARLLTKCCYRELAQPMIPVPAAAKCRRTGRISG